MYATTAMREMSRRTAELWQFREVVKNFVSQDLKVKYRRSALGFFWSVLNPLLQMLVISVVFSLLFPMHNFSLYLLSGLVPWTFIATSIDGCCMSIVSAEGMLKRQYFPKLVFPLSFILQNLVTFGLSLFVLLLVLGWVIGFRPCAALLILPVSFLCAVCVALGLGAMAAVVTVYFRDMQHLISVFLGALFYLTPIIYPLEINPPQTPPAPQAVTTAPQSHAHEGPMTRREIVAAGPIPHKYRFYFKLTPFFSIIEMFHRPIYGAMLPTARELTAALVTAMVSLGLGLAIFWRHEDRLIFAL